MKAMRRFSSLTNNSFAAAVAMCEIIGEFATIRKIATGDNQWRHLVTSDMVREIIGIFEIAVDFRQRRDTSKVPCSFAHTASTIELSFQIEEATSTFVTGKALIPRSFYEKLKTVIFDQVYGYALSYKQDFALGELYSSDSIDGVNQSLTHFSQSTDIFRQLVKLRERLIRPLHTCGNPHVYWCDVCLGLDRSILVAWVMSSLTEGVCVDYKQGKELNIREVRALLKHMYLHLKLEEPCDLLEKIEVGLVPKFENARYIQILDLYFPDRNGQVYS